MVLKFPGTENTGAFLAAGNDPDKATGVLLGCPLDDAGSFRTGSRFAPPFCGWLRPLLKSTVFTAGKISGPSFDAGDLSQHREIQKLPLRAVSRGFFLVRER